MAFPLKKIESEALELSAEERAALAERLILSLDEPTDENPADVERAWEEEIRRRHAEVEAGTAELIPAEQVLAEVRARRRG
jgi:putative addiction module component (TIGR02574 family)